MTTNVLVRVPCIFDLSIVAGNPRIANSEESLRPETLVEKRSNPSNESFDSRRAPTSGFGMSIDRARFRSGELHLLNCQRIAGADHERPFQRIDRFRKPPEPDEHHPLIVPSHGVRRPAVQVLPVKL